MNNAPLKPGQMYKEDADGNLVEVTAPVETAPVPDADLPPDRRAEYAVAQEKIDTIAENIEKISKQLVTEPVEVKEVEIPIDEKEAFLKAVISNTPYKKTFSVFKGKIKITFKTLATKEIDAVSEALVIQSGRIPYSSMLSLAGAQMRFAMASSLCEIQYHNEDGIKIVGHLSVDNTYPDTSKNDSYYFRDATGNMSKKDVVVSATPGQKVLWAAIDKFSDLSVTIYNVVFAKYQEFDAEVARMTREASNDDFFPSGGDGPSSL